MQRLQQLQKWQFGRISAKLNKKDRFRGGEEARGAAKSEEIHNRRAERFAFDLSGEKQRMGEVSILDRNAEEVRETLRDLLKDCESGDVSGAVIVIERQDGFDLQMPGTFSTDPDSLSRIIGRLQVASSVFTHMIWSEDDES